MSIPLLCSGCYAPLYGSIFVSPCQNRECPFFVKLPEIDTIMQDLDVRTLLDPALFPDNENAFDVASPQSLPSASGTASTFLSTPVLKYETLQSPASSSASEFDQTSAPFVSYGQLPFVKLQGSSLHIKRPANSFMLYRSDMMKAMKATNPKAKATGEWTRMVGKLWSQEKASVKQLYAKQARDLADIHTKNFPDYKFTPRRKPGSRH